MRTIVGKLGVCFPQIVFWGTVHKLHAIGFPFLKTGSMCVICQKHFQYVPIVPVQQLCGPLTVCAIDCVTGEHH